ncbi:MAG: GAF domain-containing SpoIIE family protein phosphatase [Bacteroidota bacterium]
MKRPAVPKPAQATESYESHFEHTALFEFSKVINSTIDLQFILSHILLTIMGKLLSTKGMVILSRDKNSFAVAMVKGFPSELAGTKLSIKHFPTSLVTLDKLNVSRNPWARVLKEAGVRTIIPMEIADRPTGLLCFGERFSRKALKNTEKTYLRSLANISATAIEKAHTLEEVQLVNRKLDRKVQELNTLFELGKEFSVILEPEKVVRLLVFSILGQIGVSRYLICFAKGPDMVVAASRIDGAVPQGEFLKALTRIKGPNRISELPAMKGLDFEPLTSIGMQVIIPMNLQGDSRGVLVLGEKMNREPFSQGDLDLLSSLGNLAIISLENARLFKEAIEKQKLEDELQIAREIQKGLLPNVLPSIPSIEIAAANISSKQVGGDYYDVITATQGRYVIAIGDVSGKGTPASLLMANLQATIRALVPLDLSISELTARVNDLMCQNTGSDKFITFFWAFIDPAAFTLTYVNAGHNYPYLIHRDRTHERLDKGGMILGIIPTTVPYEQATVQLQHGDLLVLFTDGVSEAMSKVSEEYGEERLEQLLTKRMDEPAQQISDAMHQDIVEFTKGAPQSDDITMMIVKVT